MPPTPSDRSATHDPDCPCRRELRARLFWTARWLLGCLRFHPGGIEVAISDGRPDQSGQIMIFRPREGDEMYDAANGPDAAADLADLAPCLLAQFLSADSLAILRVIADRGPVASKTVVKGVPIERTRAYALLGDLRDRRLVRDSGDGYEVAAREIWGALTRAAATATGEAA